VFFGKGDYEASIAMKRKLTEHFGSKRLSSISQSKVFVVAQRVTTGKTQTTIISNYGDIEGDYLRETNATIVEAAMATSAAPTYFKPVRIGYFDYIDGGIGNNNPTLLAVAEAEKLWPSRKISVVVSLGTGENTAIVETNNYNILNTERTTVDYMKQFVTDCDETHKRANKELKGRIPYYRLNPGGGIGGLVDLGEINSRYHDALISTCETYIADNYETMSDIVKLLHVN